MGGDGGTVAVGRKYTRGSTKNKEASSSGSGDKESAKVRALERCTHCALSRKPLREPVVYCKLGNLYNKEDLLVALLEKSLGEEFKHIRKMSAVSPCVLTPNPAFVSGKSDATKVSPFICPITQMELNGQHSFVVLKPSGRVVSAKAVNEVRGVAEGETCLKIWPSPEEQKALREKLRSKKRKGCSEKSRPSKEHKTKATGKSSEHSAINAAVSGLAAQVTDTANKQIGSSKSGSQTYAALFEKDNTDEAKDKNRLFMIGNPRGYVRT